MRLQNYHASKNSKASPEAEAMFAELRAVFQKYNAIVFANEKGSLNVNVYHKNPDSYEAFDVGPVLNENAYPDYIVV